MKREITAKTIEAIDHKEVGKCSLRELTDYIASCGYKHSQVLYALAASYREMND